MESGKYIVVTTAAGSEDEALKLARILVENKLAACVQILPKTRSIYVWKNEIQDEAEHLLLIKTTREKYDETEKTLRDNHSYEVPEIIALPIEKISREYAEWITDSVQFPY